MTFGIALTMIGVIAGAVAMWNFMPRILALQGYEIISTSSGFQVGSHAGIVHMTITIWQYKDTPYEKLILDEYHAGVVTDLGDNMTLYKLWGDIDMQYGSLNSSAYTPWISIGNDTGTLASTSTVLPNEWHREVATIEDETQSQLNMTCQITGAEISNTQVADCIGIVLTNVDDANDLWAYDIFTQVTGIDSTFTINIEFEIQQSHT